MAQVTSASLARQLGALFEGGSAAGLSDRQLLERFTGRGGPADEAAFAAIVARHGPMVLGVCRQLLGDHHHAEDAFQATFLVLARQARSIRDPDVLGAWLHGVALRTARKARTRLARKRQLDERGVNDRPEAQSAVQVEQAIDREQAEALHVEIERLPESFRLAIVSCYFEGLSPDEAAARLRWPSGTLRSRLVRARERLRCGLSRRGIVLSGTAIAAALSPRSASASVSSLLCDSTTRAAIRFAARHAATGGVLSAPAAALAQEVLQTMLVHKLKAAALALLMLAALATGAGGLAHSLNASAPPREGEPIAQEARTEPRPPDAPRPAAGRMFVVGRVLDPAGKPVPGATTMAYATAKWPGRGDRLAPMWPAAMGRAESDGSGRFRLDAPRVSSARYYDFGAVATAPGYGAGWIRLDPDLDQPAAEISLRPEQVIRGRVFDLQGRPVRDVVVSVESMALIARGDSGATPEATQGPFFLPGATNQAAAWPRPATTDADGRFTIRGAGRSLRLNLAIDDPRFARLSVEIETDESSDTKDVTMAVEPARVVTGRVTYADTGEPAPHARVEMDTFNNRGSAWAGDFETDAQGRFRGNPQAADRYGISVFAPERQPYLIASRRFEWPRGSLAQTVDLVLTRGVLVRGKVVEEGSGKPIAGARISYMSNPDNDPATGATNGREETAEDGSFQLGVMPAPGYLTVLGPGEDYVLREIGQRMARAGQPGGRRLYAHAFHKLDLKPGSASQEVTIALRPSNAVDVRVIGPDDRPVRDAVVISRVVLQPSWVAWLLWRHYYHDTARDGRFTVHGLADDVEVPVSFLDVKHNLGATARLSARSAADGPVTVRLQPCGSARARLVDRDGRPVARSADTSGSQMAMVVTPGPDSSSLDQADQGRLFADEALLTDLSLGPVYDPKRRVSDGEGRLLYPTLIPGTTYRFSPGTRGEEAGHQLRKDFTVKPGETLDLGDVRIERPK